MQGSSKGKSKLANNGNETDKSLSESKLIYTSIRKFDIWLSNNGYYSYDRMDYWSSKTGVLAKKIFYKNKYLGIPLALWGLVLENFLPSIQKFYAKPHREIIGDAHFASAYLNLFENTNDKKYLVKAEKLFDEMLRYRSKDYSNLSWGYNFGWQTQHGFWDIGVPLITITPYAFWAFRKHYEITNNISSYKYAISIADFALEDLNDNKMPNGTFCASYSPRSKDIVINANSYRSALLLEAYKISKDIKYKITAERNIEFILSYQGKEGEFYYEAKGPQNNFIDNFHTCFVLRNLTRCYYVNYDQNLLNSIKKGYKYYSKNLFHGNGRPKHFSVAKYAKLRRYEMYDYAEGIILGVLLKDVIPEAYDKAKWLAIDLIDNFQLSSGYFVTRVTSLGTKHKIPYLRWPQAQIFYAMTLLLRELEA